MFPWLAQSCAWRGGRVAEEKGHPVPFRTFSHGSPGGARPSRRSSGRENTEDKGTQTRFGGNTWPGLSSAGLGAPQAGPTEAGSSWEPGACPSTKPQAKQHLAAPRDSFRSCKQGWCGAAATLHFLLAAQLHRAALLPEEVRLLFNSFFAI